MTQISIHQDCNNVPVSTVELEVLSLSMSPVSTCAGSSVTEVWTGVVDRVEDSGGFHVTAGREVSDVTASVSRGHDDVII